MTTSVQETGVEPVSETSFVSGIPETVGSDQHGITIR
jgi:hypothetical protein